MLNMDEALQAVAQQNSPVSYSGSTLRNLKVDGGYLEFFRADTKKREAALRKSMLRGLLFVLDSGGFKFKSVTLTWPKMPDSYGNRNLTARLVYDRISNSKRLDLIRLMHSLGVINSHDTPKLFTFEFKVSD